MTAQSTIDWMKNTEFKPGEPYIKRWILPELGCNQQFPHYRNAPVGNTSQVQPLDAQLNQDIKQGVRRHVSLTLDQPEEDPNDPSKPNPKKFSLTTPKRISFAFDRIWNFGLEAADCYQNYNPDAGIPCSRRVIQDIDLAFESMAMYDRSKGAFSEELGAGNRGRRGQLDAERGKKDRRGGKRTKMSMEDSINKLGGGKWTHPMVDNASKKMSATAKARFLSETNGSETEM